MPRNAKRDQMVKEERRRQILQAATSVFYHKGLAAVKMSDVATEAGLSYGHVYNHFSSKQELLASIVLEGQEAYRRFLLQAIESPGDAVSKLQRIIDQLFIHSNTAKTYWIVLQAQASDILPEDVKGEIKARMLHNLDLFSRIIIQGQEEGRFAAGDAKEITTIVITLLHNSGLWEIRGLESPKQPILTYILKLVSL
ncbi:TetR/AcrR family transcriptional regulator [Paenibacillus filicis]|uniref:TetR/AcrR family transcriptional regulator n=2 Tax=Paenibacillus filicis TaxID=669464 RepID=A0ABU9DD14_9BACL